MKKIIGILGVAVFALTLFMNATLIINELSGNNNSIIAEASAQIQESNFSMQDVAYRSGMHGTIGVSEVGWWASIIYDWTYIRCCMQSVDANSCNFSMEDPSCSSHAIRPGH